MPSLFSLLVRSFTPKIGLEKRDKLKDETKTEQLRGGEKYKEEEEGGMKGEEVEGKYGEKTRCGRSPPHTCHHV